MERPVPWLRLSKRTKPPPKRPKKRALSKLFTVKVAPDGTGCHVWTAAKDKDGYGQFRDGKRVRQAHVYRWEIENGPLPKGFEIDHQCRNRACVNLQHLEKVTHEENMKRQREAQDRLGGEKSERTAQRHRQKAREKHAAAVARALEPLDAALWLAELGDSASAAEMAARIVTAGRDPDEAPDAEALAQLARAAADEHYAEARSGSTRFTSGYLTRALNRAVLHLDKMTPLVPPQNSSFHARTIQQMRDEMGGDLTAWPNIVVDFGDLREPDERIAQLIAYVRERDPEMADELEREAVER